MKLEVKYLFPALSTVQLQLPNFPTSFFIFIYQLPEGLGLRKTLSHGIAKQSANQGG